MRRNYWHISTGCILLTGITCSCDAALLGLYNIAGATAGDVASLSASSGASGLTFGTLTRGAGVSSDPYWASTPSMFSARNWTTAATRDATDYLQVALTIDPGHTATPSSLTYGLYQEHSASAFGYVGPAKWDLLYSLDGFASAGTVLRSGDIVAAPESTLGQITVVADLTSLGTLSAGQQVTFRFYGYNRTGSEVDSSGGFANGTGPVPGGSGYNWQGSGSDVRFEGTVTAVPEPGVLLPTIGLLGFAGWQTSRRVLRRS